MTTNDIDAIKEKISTECLKPLLHLTESIYANSNFMLKGVKEVATESCKKCLQENISSTITLLQNLSTHIGTL